MPEVKVSHIKIPLSESFGNIENDKSNNLFESTCSTMNYLVPGTSDFRRDSYGSGDSGYLGGAQNSSSNLATSVPDDEIDSSFPETPQRISNSKSEYKIRSKEIPLVFNFDRHSSPKRFPKNGFNSSRNKEALLIIDKQWTPSLLQKYSSASQLPEKNFDSLSLFHRNDSCNFENNFLHPLINIKNSWKQYWKNNLKRNSSVNYYSDSEIMTSRSDSMLNCNSHKHTKTRKSYDCPFENERQNSIPKSTTSIEKIGKTTSSVVRRNLSTSFSQQDSEETEVSILNLG